MVMRAMASSARASFCCRVKRDIVCSIKVFELRKVETVIRSNVEDYLGGRDGEVQAG